MPASAARFGSRDAWQGGHSHHWGFAWDLRVGSPSNSNRTGHTGAGGDLMVQPWTLLPDRLRRGVGPNEASPLSRDSRRSYQAVGTSRPALFDSLPRDAQQDRDLLGAKALCVQSPDLGAL